ncbi:MAG: LamG-like jellyroll fold domain-containing protein [Candidatus Paceibacterota bacterium]|jgi:prepilin-type N-terminal cleavage/methylation domain-containing protein
MRNKAFTLIELLVVIAIVGILSSVIYTNITGLRDRARITAGIRFDSSTLHSIGDQLVGEWLFDEGSTTSAIDTSGSGNSVYRPDSTWPVYQATGGYNNKGAYRFDGIADLIAVPNSSSLSAQSITNNITISAWIKPSATQIGDIVSRNGPYHLGFGLWGVYQKVCAAIYTGTWGSLCGKSIIPTDTWSHIAMTYNGSMITVYLNGALDGSISKTGNMSAGGVPVYIGGTTQIGFDNQYFKGLLDDIRIYSSTLSSLEIQKIYAEGISDHPISLK